jgi:hypothetical protein
MTSELLTRLYLSTYQHLKRKISILTTFSGRLQELIEQEKLHLLITDVTKKEIENHLRKHAKEAASKIKKLTKEGQNL